jgi:hypothetical protein
MLPRGTLKEVGKGARKTYYLLCHKRASARPPLQVREERHAFRSGGTKNAFSYVVNFQCMRMAFINRATNNTREAVARSRIACAVLLVSSLGGRSVFAQVSVLEHFNPMSSKAAGVHLYGATISSSYFSSSYGTQGSAIGFGFSPGGYDAPITMLQGSAVFGWSRPGPKSSFSAIYSPSYVRGLNSSGYRSLNHALSVSASGTLNPKWSVATSLNAIISDLGQLVIAPTPYGNVSAIPATFDEFAAAVLTGHSANPGLNQAVNSAPVINSAERAFLYGDRLFSTSAGMSLSYTYSSRSSFGVSLSGLRSQRFRTGSNATDLISPLASVPNTSSGSAGLGWSYSLTPRTTASLNVSSNRTFSRFQDAYSTQAGVSLGRTLSQQWFVNGMVGVGFITPIRSTFQPSQKPQTLYGGGIGYKFYAQTLVASYARSISDIYGLGANATESSSTSWSWKRPGQSISLSASGAYSRMITSAFANSASWIAHVSVGKSLSAHLALSGGYSYTQFPRSLLNTTTGSLSQNGVSISLSWSPSERQ